MTDAYSPHTGEHIATDSPAPWMGRAGTPAPEYDSQTHGCFWRDGDWVLVESHQTTEPVPQEVTMAQCRLALFDLTDIKTDEQFFGLVDLLPEEDRARALLELRTRPTVRRDNPLVVSLGGAQGWDLDELFIYASKQ